MSLKSSDSVAYKKKGGENVPDLREKTAKTKTKTNA